MHERRSRVDHPLQRRLQRVRARHHLRRGRDGVRVRVLRARHPDARGRGVRAQVRRRRRHGQAGGDDRAARRRRRPARRRRHARRREARPRRRRIRGPRRRPGAVGARPALLPEPGARLPARRHARPAPARRQLLDHGQRLHGGPGRQVRHRRHRRVAQARRGDVPRHVVVRQLPVRLHVASDRLHPGVPDGAHRTRARLRLVREDRRAHRGHASSLQPSRGLQPADDHGESAVARPAAAGEGRHRRDHHRRGSHDRRVLRSDELGPATRRCRARPSSRSWASTASWPTTEGRRREHEQAQCPQPEGRRRLSRLSRGDRHHAALRRRRQLRTRLAAGAALRCRRSQGRQPVRHPPDGGMGQHDRRPAHRPDEAPLAALGSERSQADLRRRGDGRTAGRPGQPGPAHDDRERTWTRSAT